MSGSDAGFEGGREKGKTGWCNDFRSESPGALNALQNATKEPTVGTCVARLCIGTGKSMAACAVSRQGDSFKTRGNTQNLATEREGNRQVESSGKGKRSDAEEDRG